MSTRNSKSNQKTHNNKGRNSRTGKYNPKGNKRDYIPKNARRVDEIVDTEARMSRSNPFSFYNRFPQMAEDVGKLAFGLPLGQAINVFDEHVSDNSAPSDFKFTVPGVCAIHFSPSIGWSEDNTSPINRSVQRFFTYLRNVQKAAANYDAPDVGMYLLAYDSLYSFWKMMRRAYGIAQLYTPVNKYYPLTLLRAMGFHSSITDNLAEFRAYINKFALSLGQFTIPSGIQFVERHAWMNEGLYTDGTSTRAQTYVFVQDGFWQYNNLGEQGTNLIYVPRPTAPFTLSSLQAFGKQLLNAIRADEDLGWMSGDIYAGFGSNIMKTELTDSNYAVLPAYDEVVLSQIENLTISGDWYTDYTPVVKQNPTVNNGAIIFTPVVAGYVTTVGTIQSNLMFATKKLLNVRSENPTSQQVIEATRLMADGDQDQQAGAKVLLRKCGTEIVHYLEINLINPANVDAIKSAKIYTQYIDLTTSNNGQSSVEILTLLSNFDWHPMLQYWEQGADTNTLPKIFGVFGDIDNITVVTNSQLDMMHEVALLSEFDVPQMGFLNKANGASTDSMG